MITNLRRCLYQSGLTSSQVAERIGVSETLMSEFVCGHRPIRPIHHLLNLSRVLERRPSELLGFSDVD